MGGTSGGGTGGSSIPLTGNCAGLTCLNPMVDLLATCQVGATEACTEAMTMTGTALVASDCYTSGVKMQTSVGMDMSSATMTVENGSSVCYSILMSGLSGSAVTMVVKNGSGTTIGTIAEDTTTSVETVTCPGGAPTVVDSSCGSGGTTSTGVAPGSGAACTTGICAF